MIFHVCASPLYLGVCGAPITNFKLWVTSHVTNYSSEDFYCGINHILHSAEWYGLKFHFHHVLFSLAPGWNIIAYSWNISPYHNLTYFISIIIYWSIWITLSVTSDIVFGGIFYCICYIVKMYIPDYGVVCTCHFISIFFCIAILLNKIQLIFLPL